MKLIIAVTDACIFIDLYDLGLVNSFFQLDLEIHTTISVYFELYAEQQQILKAYQTVDRLTVHNLQEEDFLQIQSESYPKSLSETDKSVLHVANKLNACVLSSDKTVRNCAKNKDIEFHGMIWIFDKLVEAAILTKKQAAQKLEELVATNFIFQNNKTLVAEIEKRLKIWKQNS
ncbi:PIN domain-containing protein [Flavihumibacter sp. UBA7668]|uniref:PIN domain-containing protein n=1 Tax=Flavihumibacter sp. UBA7668 TaxID=1946542 RepID=UPI0025BEAF79|nr:PIN domain-containing protein [Flavihumibacter sp. UBA7668]